MGMFHMSYHDPGSCFALIKTLFFILIVYFPYLLNGVSTALLPVSFLIVVFLSVGFFYSWGLFQKGVSTN